MPSILLVRHAQASFGGDDYDVLSELGHRQAAALDEVLRLHADGSVACAASGSLRRQLDTAAGCALTRDMEVDVDPRWNEYDSADVLANHADVDASLEGGEISSRDFQKVLDAALHAWIDAGDDSPCAESWPAFESRVLGALADLTSRLDRGSSAVVFTSGGAIAGAAARLLEAPAHSFVALNRVTVNAGVTKLIHGRGGTRLVTFNEHGHLIGPESMLTYR